MSASKFVSNIPNNKLEPVFLGGGSGPSPNTKSSGAYVPAFLRNQKEQEQPNKTETVNKQKEFKIVEDDFPGLSSTNKLVEPQANITRYSDALKKDIEIAKLKPKTKHDSGKSVQKKASETERVKQRILDDYSDEYSDEYVEDY